MPPGSRRRPGIAGSRFFSDNVAGLDRLLGGYDNEVLAEVYGEAEATTSDQRLSSNLHLYATAPLRTWAWLLRDNRGVSPSYLGKLLRVLATSALFSPLRLWDRIRFGGTVARTTIDKPPVFIVGFPRSGTTHLHNLLLQDSQFGAVTNYQAAVPTCFMAGGDWLKRLFAKFAPATRPMDNVRVDMDMPQEEEIAIANSCHVSWLHHFSFPRRARLYFDKYVMMQELSDRELGLWQRTFMDVARRAALASRGRRLVMKSPTHTGRIPYLLQLFPEARFIHIVRRPFDVYRSMMHLYGKLLPIHQLQVMEPGDMGDHVVYAYKAMMGNLLKEKTLAPDGRFVEIRFEDLERRPLLELERIYSTLALPGWDRARPRFEAYLGTISGYRKNVFRFDQELMDRVNDEWAFALDAWNYRRPGERGGATPPEDRQVPDDNFKFRVRRRRQST